MPARRSQPPSSSSTKWHAHAVKAIAAAIQLEHDLPRAHAGKAIAAAIQLEHDLPRAHAPMRGKVVRRVSADRFVAR